MKKLVKTLQLSTNYSTWLNNFGNNNHTKYNPSNRFYYGIVMELFKHQNGLCVYTEISLCDPDFFDTCNWSNGSYICTKPTGFNEPEFFGNLDHFDPTLKKNQGWLWDNFFMIHSDINRDKNNKYVDYIMKPDGNTYNEFNLLSYNPNSNIFTPNASNTNLNLNDIALIQGAIDVLGINHSSIKCYRKIVLRRKQADVEKGVTTWNSDVKEFPTAHRMMEIMFNAGTLPSITSY